jgi:hypothetical protein
MGNTTVKAPSSAEREQWLSNVVKEMFRYTFESVWIPGSRAGNTPWMVFAAAEGVETIANPENILNKDKVTIPLNYSLDPAKTGYYFDSDHHEVSVKFTNLGVDGQLKGTLLLPVSGHAGIENAKVWAKNDTYSIFLVDENDRTVAVVARDVKSLDYISIQEVDVKIQPNKIYKLTYHRSGSGGPWGFPAGRILTFTWDGK